MRLSIDDELKETPIHRENEIVMTVGEVAAAFANMGSDQQALFFSEIAKRANNWPMQLEYVRQDENLTNDGRSMMQLIGEYGTPLTLSEQVKE